MSNFLGDGTLGHTPLDGISGLAGDPPSGIPATRCASIEVVDDSSVRENEKGSVATGLPSVLFRDFQPGTLSADPGAAAEVEGDDDVRQLVRGGGWLGSVPAVQEKRVNGRMLPRLGDEVMGFRLVRLLGRGAFARVFLAEQLALSGRRVAVKISRAKRDESQTLAQLQHTHIVPVYSSHVDAATGLRMLVMPYFGGTTLDRLLTQAELQAGPKATGLNLITALDSLAPNELAVQPNGSVGESLDWPASQSPSESVTPSWDAASWFRSRVLGKARLVSWRPNPTVDPAIGQPARYMLARSSYVQAMTWIAARLAEGLAHAHQRGILHRDIKPSNILIASDGQPMFLDFNLALDVKSPDSGAVAYVGGTLPYMAPEHLDAFNAQNPTPATAVDERSDIYSLGVVFFEMLTNRHPFTQSQGSEESLPAILERMAAERRSKAPLPACPNIPPSLAAIVERCLQPDPANRYQTSSQLAEDLQCELDNLPLRHTPEPNRINRLKKWARRHPRLSSAGSLGACSAAVLIGLSALVLTIGGRLAGYDAERRWLQFQQGLIRAQLLVHTGREPAQNLAEGKRICEQTLALFDVLGGKQSNYHARSARLSPDQQVRLREGILELVLLLARVQAEQAQLEKTAKGQAALLEEAVEALDWAERFDPDRVAASLYEDRGSYRLLLGDHAGAEQDRLRAQKTPLRTARDHYLRAISLSLAKKPEAAIRTLDAGLRIDPKHFWSHFLLGICYDQLGRNGEAIGAYRAAIAIWPEFHWSYVNRGCANGRIHNWSDAILDQSEAIRLSPKCGEAFANRAIAHLNRHSYEAAEADFNRAIELGQASGTLLAGRAAARAALGQLDAAQADFEEARRLSPDDAAIRISRGFALARHAPELALADFDHVIERDEQSANAHYGRAYVLSFNPDRAADALEAVQQALELNPTFAVARATRALLLARQLQIQAAIEEAEAALAQQPSSAVRYTAACTYAVASQADPQLRLRAIELLEAATRDGFAQDLFETDSDLSELRSMPEFAKLVTASK